MPLLRLHSLESGITAVTFRFDPMLVDAMKANGMRFDPDGKMTSLQKSWWTDDPKVAEKLKLVAGEADARSIHAELTRARREAIVASFASDSDREFPVPKGLSYLPYQRAGIAFALDRQGTLFGDEPGLGKTVEAVGVLNTITNIIRALVICPASLKTNWLRELRKWLVYKDLTVGVAQGGYLPDTNIVVINYDIVKRHKKDLLDIKWDAIIADECFVAGTLVSTPTGSVPIEQLAPGDMIVHAAGTGFVKAVSAKPSSDIYRLEFSDGIITYCTGNHPYFTSQGWTPAGRLELGRLAYREEDLQAMRERVLSNSPSWSGRPDAGAAVRLLDEAGVLLAVLRKDAEEPSEEAGGGGQDVGDDEAHRAQTAVAGRKWEGFDVGAERVAGAPWDRLDSRVPGEDRKAGWHWLPDVLQGGPSGSVVPDSSGGGRSGSQFAEEPSQGLEEGWIASQPRLVGISRVQCESPRTVYNLQVSGHPSFFANGHLVHNCHLMKNQQAERTRAIFGVRSKKKGEWIEPPLTAPVRLGLSGTPILNRPAEIFTTLNWLAPDQWPSRGAFGRRYCAGGTSFYDGASNLQELQVRLRSSVMIRRLKSEVLTDLPAKMRQVIEFDDPESAGKIEAERTAAQKYEMGLAMLKAAAELAKASDNPDEYKDAILALRRGVSAAFDELAKLRYDTAMSKVPYVIGHLKGLFEQMPDAKFVVFAHHHDVMDRIYEAFPWQSVKLSGDMSTEARQKSVDRFQTDASVRLFVGSMKAAGVGLTLTASSHVVFAELDWVPATLSQAEDRTHRVGQKNTVLVQHLVLAGSLDAVISRRIIDKQAVIDQALDQRVDNADIVIPTVAVESYEGARIEEIDRESVTFSDDRIGRVQAALHALPTPENPVDQIIVSRLKELKVLTARQAALADKVISRNLVDKPVAV